MGFIQAETGTDFLDPDTSMNTPFLIAGLAAFMSFRRHGSGVNGIAFVG
jgi:hypothetical protein